MDKRRKRGMERRKGKQEKESRKGKIRKGEK
jgi:hypothetical protein